MHVCASFRWFRRSNSYFLSYLCPVLILHHYCTVFEWCIIVFHANDNIPFFFSIYIWFGFGSFFLCFHLLHEQAQNLNIAAVLLYIYLFNLHWNVAFFSEFNDYIVHFAGILYWKSFLSLLFCCAVFFFKIGSLMLLHIFSCNPINRFRLKFTIASLLMAFTENGIN